MTDNIRSSKRRSGAGAPPPADTFSGHLPLLRRFLARLLPRKHDIDDVAQEAYLRAFQAEKQTTVHSPRAFLFRIARNIALNELNRKSRVMTDYIEDSLARDVLDDTGGPDEHAAQQQRLALFCEAVATLPVQCRRTFLLMKVYGHSQKEVARELGIAVSTVEKHVASGLLRCSQYIEDKARMSDNTAATPPAENSRVTGR